MRNFWRGFVLISMVLLVFVTGSVMAQAWRGRGRVKGKVTDEQGNPIEGVTVKLWLVDKDAGFNVKTNKNGEWHANFIRGGTWNIDFEKEGYVPYKISIKLKGYGQNEDIDVTLQKLKAPAIPPELLDDVDKGNQLFAQKKYQEALAVFESLVEKYPTVKILHWNVGNCYYELGQYEKAIEHYMMAKDEYPDEAEFWMTIGNTYLMMKQFDKAIESFNKIGIEKIDNPVTLYNLGEIFFAQNQMDQAIVALARAVQLKPDYLDALYLLGTAYIGKGDKDKARATLQQYLQYDSTSDRAKEVELLLKSLG